MKDLVTTIVFLFLISCSTKNSNEYYHSLIKDSIVQEPMQDDSKESSFKIINNSIYTVKLLLDASGERFDNPSSDYHYYIGDSKLFMVKGDTNYFLLPRKYLRIQNDTIFFVNGKLSLPGGEPTVPDAFINYQYPTKYNALPCEYKSRKFGKIQVTNNGLSCDDSFSGEVRVGDNTEIILKGLANVDVFELDNGEIYILSYHNCLLPSLKIFRIK